MKYITNTFVGFVILGVILFVVVVVLKLIGWVWALVGVLFLVWLAYEIGEGVIEEYKEWKKWRKK